MYGLVNRAIAGLVRLHYGPQAWERVQAKADWRGDEFVSMEIYPDALTYSLVGAVSEETGLTQEAVLEAFGEYWTTYTIEEGYGDTLSMMGTTMEEFLSNLDSMHTRIGLAMPEMIPPHFNLEVVDSQLWKLRYSSDRPGLASMVTGLLRGLATRFDESIQVRIEPGGSEEETIFLIDRGQPGEKAE